MLVPVPQSKSEVKQLLESQQYVIRRDFSQNTLIAYSKDIWHYLSFVQKQQKTYTTDQIHERYLKELSEKYAFATFSRKLVAINCYFELQGIEGLFLAQHIHEAKAHIKRNRFMMQSKAKVFTKAHLKSVLDKLNDPKVKNTLVSIRNKNLLLLGYTAALRMSELLALRVQDIHFVKDAAIIHIRKSKSNQYGKLDERVLPVSTNTPYCPVLALRSLLATLPKTGNPYLFYALNTNDTYKMKQPLSSSGCQLIIKKLLGKEYSTHSLRRSFVSIAKKYGAMDSEIQAQTKHASVKMIQEYTSLSVHEHNAVTKVLL